LNYNEEKLYNYLYALKVMSTATFKEVNNKIRDLLKMRGRNIVEFEK